MKKSPRERARGTARPGQLSQGLGAAVRVGEPPYPFTTCSHTLPFHMIALENGAMQLIVAPMSRNVVHGGVRATHLIMQNIATGSPAVQAKDP